MTAGAAAADIDADNGVMGVLRGGSQLYLLSYDRFGALTPSAPIGLGVTTANGVAILGTQDRDD